MQLYIQCFFFFFRNTLSLQYNWELSLRSFLKQKFFLDFCIYLLMLLCVELCKIF